MFKETKDMNTPTVEEIAGEIVGWMNYGIPRGKTIPDFRTLLTSYGTARYEEGVKHGAQQERKFIENILDGIEEAERLEGEPFSTNTIRFALKNRII